MKNRMEESEMETKSPETSQSAENFSSIDMAIPVWAIATHLFWDNEYRVRIAREDARNTNEIPEVLIMNRKVVQFIMGLDPLTYHYYRFIRSDGSVRIDLPGMFDRAQWTNLEYVAHLTKQWIKAFEMRVWANT